LGGLVAVCFMAPDENDCFELKVLSMCRSDPLVFSTGRELWHHYVSEPDN
jgi:hypothetical protein